MKTITISFFLLSVGIFFSNPLFSQVKYTSTGNFGIGTTSPRGHFHLKASTPELFYEASGSSMLFRYVSSPSSFKGAYTQLYSSTGNLYYGIHPASTFTTSDDKNIIKIGGTYGDLTHFYQSTSSYSNAFVSEVLNQYTKCYVVKYGGSHNFFIYGNGKVWHSGIQQLSDESLKENVVEIGNSLELLSQLRPVKYNYIQGAFGGESLNPEIEYGLIAQEVEKVIPDVVETRDDGLKGISYNELTALLIDAIQIQQDAINQLRSEITGATKKSLVTSDNTTNSEINAYLFQNVPNPFNRTTTIKYIIPELKGDASVNIYDLRGKQLQSYMINQSGEGTIEIEGSVLHPGIYLYNLIVEGYIVDSKQMVLTD